MPGCGPRIASCGRGWGGGGRGKGCLRSCSHSANVGPAVPRVPGAREHEARERSRDARCTASLGPERPGGKPRKAHLVGSVSPARTIPSLASPLALPRGARRGGLVPAREPRVPAGRRLENHCSRGQTEPNPGRLLAAPVALRGADGGPSGFPQGLSDKALAGPCWPHSAGEAPAPWALEAALDPAVAETRGTQTRSVLRLTAIEASCSGHDPSVPHPGPWHCSWTRTYI